MPAGVIDPALWEGDFYIIYEPVSGCVTDVFYAEESIQINSNFQQFYDQWSTASRDQRMREAVPMLGYYGGGTAQGEQWEKLQSPGVRVTIHNGEKLTVEVSFHIPEALKDVAVEKNVTLEYGETRIPLLENGVNKCSGRYWEEQDGAAGSLSCFWVLDSLEENALGEEQRFLGLLGGGDAAAGGDFSVTASAASPQGRFTAATGRDTDNSLFAKGSGNETAVIACLRHLQNLDQEFSGVKGKSAAVQTADISCKSNEIYSGYEFRPIENSGLRSYDGKGYRIRDLYVTASSSAGKDGAGLFARIEGSPGEPRRLSNMRLVNAYAEAAGGGGTAAGAVAGRASYAELQGCWVYWEPESGSMNLSSLLGSDEEGYSYQVIGDFAGGLVGELGSSRITDCLAATMVQGGSAAGGLAGRSLGDAVTIENSYADCYLYGKNAAGLVGMTYTSMTLMDCYAAGFIDMAAADTAAGLCLGGDVKVEAERVYSAMRYPEKSDADKVYMLTATQDIANNDIFKSAYYMGEGSVGTVDGYRGVGMSYMELTAKKGTDNFAGKLGDAFGWKTAVHSNPYNLRIRQNLVIYSFPGLKSLPHYGDWGAEFREPSLVYYEQYSQEGQYGFSGGNARYLLGELSDGGTILSDGYAVAFLKSDLGEKEKVEIAYTYFSQEAQRKESLVYARGASQDGETSLVLTVWEGKEYYLAFLPETLVLGEPEGENFFRYLRCELKLSDTGEKENPATECFYNPHFAETVIPYVEEGELTRWTAAAADEYASKLLEQRSIINVRTARHLYDLSRYEAYYHDEKHQYTFRQEMDLDYSIYAGYGLFTGAGGKSFLQTPIGGSAAAFKGTYDGGCHSIRGVAFLPPETTGDPYGGLFGYSEGVLKNIVYLMNGEETLNLPMGSNARGLYIGSLAGGNAGVIRNCAAAGVRLDGEVYNASAYIGGLVGRNNGIVSSCAAEVAGLSVSVSNYGYAYVGGLVGENAANRDIDASYAVGRLYADVDRTSHAKICGFAGYNSGGIRGCYTAADLRSSGAGVETNGFCGVTAGTQDGTYYLNEGNFVYRDISYTAYYEKKRAEPVKYDRLAGENALVEGMSVNVEARENGASDSYPYPSALKDAEGVPVHYGSWPQRMELGEMGVYYWEKLENGSNAAYYISLMAVDPNKHIVEKHSTLSQARNDGAVVTDCGYGYYVQEDREGQVKLSAQGISYSEEGGAGRPFSSGEASDPEVDAALAALMEGFVFHSYHSFGMEEDGGGLYPVGMTGGTGTAADTPNGRFQLVQDVVSVTFYINPFFADAMSLVEKSTVTVNGKEETSKWNQGAGESALAPRALPGEKDNPYGIRSIAQLEFINWNSSRLDTHTVIYWWESGTKRMNNGEEFPYLSSSTKTKQYYWKQSHDIDGGNKVYTPIAEYYDTTTANENRGYLYGWFGGVFDGDNYIIKNVNIKGQKASCAGLFGAVYNGILKNMVLYSEDGTGTVTAGHYGKGAAGGESDSRWYAIGALAGVAASHTGNAVQNCAVAGYTIVADVYTADGGDNGSWGGSGIGGLLGISNMPLSGCSAVTEIYVPGKGSAYQGAVANDNVRIGGLAGACQQSISDCYAGGEIRIDSDVGIKTNSGIYIGGIVGGSYMKPLQVGDNKNLTIGYIDDPGTGWGNTEGWTSNSLEDCYSYVRLPEKGAHERIKALYALGGTGEIYKVSSAAHNHGECTIKNCFYLKDQTLANNGGSLDGDVDGTGGRLKTDIGRTGEVFALTYGQLAGEETIRGVAGIGGIAEPDIYDVLKDFAPVTAVTADGYSIAGKYSYAPASDSALQGTNYPFPTILTQGTERNHVHYGSWPVSGIYRDRGGETVVLDLFTEPDMQRVEVLRLSPDIQEGGSWSVESDAPGIASAELPVRTGDRAYSLTVEGKEIGVAGLTVSYQIGNTRYSIRIVVHVTAELRLQPAQVTLFTRDEAAVRLTPQNRDGNPIVGGTLRELRLYWDRKSIVSMVPETDAGTGEVSLIMTTDTEVSQAEMININYTYDYRGMEHVGTATVKASVVDPPAPEHEAGDGIREERWIIAFDEDRVENLAAEWTESFAPGQEPQIRVEDNVIILTKVQRAAELKITLTMDGQEHCFCMEVEP